MDQPKVVQKMDDQTQQIIESIDHARDTLNYVKNKLQAIKPYAHQTLIKHLEATVNCGGGRRAANCGMCPDDGCHGECSWDKTSKSCKARVFVEDWSWLDWHNNRRGMRPIFFV